MAGFIELVQRYVAPYYYYVIGLIVFIIFVIVAKYGYDKFYAGKEKRGDKVFSNVANATMRDNIATVYFFHVDWCPHCKTATPEWNKFKAGNDGKKVNGYVVNCVEVNCTNEDSEITKTINEYKIQGYPTVKMVKDGQKIEFDSKITQGTLEQFVNTMLD
jgi:thiol-disulfide isomerase/thioredoxin